MNRQGHVPICGMLKQGFHPGHKNIMACQSVTCC